MFLFIIAPLELYNPLIPRDLICHSYTNSTSDDVPQNRIPTDSRRKMANGNHMFILAFADPQSSIILQKYKGTNENNQMLLIIVENGISFSCSGYG